MKTCVICISKDAHDTINDWIEHYLNIGFNHIFLFDNNDYDKRYHIENKDVSLIPYYGLPIFSGDGEWRQCILCKIGLFMAFDQNYTHAFICDDDEFLDLNSHIKYNNINEFINKYGAYDNLRIYEEIVNDNGYIYIEDEPKDKSKREIYTDCNPINIKDINNFEKVKFKTICKIPNKKKMYEIMGGFNYISMHFIYTEKTLCIVPTDITYKHYKTYCLERYLKRKTNYGGHTDCMSNRFLNYFLLYNKVSDKKLKAYVELCEKYNIELSDEDKYILDEYKIKYKID